MQRWAARPPEGLLASLKPRGPCELSYVGVRKQGLFPTKSRRPAVLGRGMTLGLASVFGGGSWLRRRRAGDCVSAAITAPQGMSPLVLERDLGSTLKHSPQSTPGTTHIPLLLEVLLGLFAEINS